MVGGVTTASTAIEKPVTLASIAVAPLGLLVALAIVDCTEVAVTAYVWMLTWTMTLPDVTVTITADGSTPARAANALFISVRTLGVNEETSPASSRANSTTLIAGGDGGGEGEGGGGEGEGGGGEGEGGGGEDEGGARFGAVVSASPVSTAPCWARKFKSRLSCASLSAATRATMFATESGSAAPAAPP